MLHYFFFFMTFCWRNRIDKDLYTVSDLRGGWRAQGVGMLVPSLVLKSPTFPSSSSGKKNKLECFGPTRNAVWLSSATRPRGVSPSVHPGTGQLRGPSEVRTLTRKHLKLRTRTCRNRIRVYGSWWVDPIGCSPPSNRKWLGVRF